MDPIKVLIVDDQTMFSESLSEILNSEPGIEVTERASTAAEAESIVDRHPIDVVLMDFKLPDKNGSAATASIKERHPEVQVVLITGYPDEDILLSALEAGASGFISKSQATSEAVSALRRAHEGDTVIDPTTLAKLLPKLRYRSKEEGLSPELTRREVEVLKLLAEGTSNREIAEKLHLSIHTVRKHVQNISTKLEAHSKLEAVSKAIRLGIIRL